MSHKTEDTYYYETLHFRADSLGGAWSRILEPTEAFENLKNGMVNGVEVNEAGPGNHEAAPSGHQSSHTKQFIL